MGVRNKPAEMDGLTTAVNFFFFGNKTNINNNAVKEQKLKPQVFTCLWSCDSEYPQSWKNRENEGMTVGINTEAGA